MKATFSSAVLVHFHFEVRSDSPKAGHSDWLYK